jgi:hypothetical protein
MPGPWGSGGDADAGRIHLKGAYDCIAFSSRVVEHIPEHCGWAVTAIFYAAVHFVRAYLTSVKGCVITRHEDLRTKYDEYPELRRVKAAYEHLKQQSEKARYYATPFALTDVTSLRRQLETVSKTIIPWLPTALREYYERDCKPEA